jgi:hypothetical protein
MGLKGSYRAYEETASVSLEWQATVVLQERFQTMKPPSPVQAGSRVGPTGHFHHVWPLRVQGHGAS